MTPTAKLFPTVYYVAKCSKFSERSEAYHVDEATGKAPVILIPVAGRAPRTRLVVSGTVADSEGFEPGKNYYVMSQHTNNVELEDGTINPSFSYTNLGEFTPEQVMEKIEAKPLETPLVPPSLDVDDEGNMVTEKVKGNPNARRLRNRTTREERKEATKQAQESGDKQPSSEGEQSSKKEKTT